MGNSANHYSVVSRSYGLRLEDTASMPCSRCKKWTNTNLTCAECGTVLEFRHRENAYPALLAKKQGITCSNCNGTEFVA